MFVRFRTAGRRLQASLIETRRVDGKVRHEHVASLGSIAAEPSVTDRATFWRGLHRRLDRLTNRLDVAAQAKLLGEVHGRIPMVTVGDIRAAQIEAAEGEARFWDGWAHMNAATAAEHRELIRKVERTVAAAEAGKEMAGAKTAAAKDRVARLKRGEAVSGPLRERTAEEWERELLAAGFTKRQLKVLRQAGELDDIAFEEWLADIHRINDHLRGPVHRALLKALRRQEIRQVLDELGLPHGE